MSVVAVVPVRTPGEGKSRLAGVLSASRRSALVQSMLARVLGALQAAKRIDRIVVVTPDDHLPLPSGVELLHDHGTGLNEAVSLAQRALADRDRAMLVVAADAPQVTAEEIDRLVERAADLDVAVVPDRHGLGTNALWLRLPTALLPQYGEGSAQAHLAAAHRLGLRALRIEVPGLSHDVDVPDDLQGEPMPAEQALLLAAETDLAALMQRARELTLDGFGVRVGYSRKVFIPLTHWCRDVCHYCTFAAPPRRGERAFLAIEEVLEIARRGAAAGCDEALFTLGDKPELRYPQARAELAALGFDSTLEYLAYCAQRVFEETGLLPHLNPGVMERDELAMLRPVSASMGIMLESVAERLTQKGGPHHRSPDKHPAVRLATMARAGELSIPFTTGLLIGIGETRRERIETLLAIRELHLRHGHIQEVIVQNFRAKPGTRMAMQPEPALEELQWTIAVARRIFGAGMSIQAPPNLSPGALRALLDAGVNDWGGVSPVTPDHVNPEAPWPQLAALERETAEAGRWLVQRLPILPAYANDPRWLDPALHTAVRRRIDASGYVREPAWHAGAGDPPQPRYRKLVRDTRAVGTVSPRIADTLRRCVDGNPPDEEAIARLFSADGADYHAILATADALRSAVNGETVTYVVNRNINYTNICTYSCGFCAFAKGRSARALRGPGYRLDFAEIEQRVAEAAARGATEVCLQGGIHPSFTGETYLEIVRSALRAAPGIHVHAFSPLEITHGAATLDLSVEEFLSQLAAAGLRTLPGTAAEILCDDVRGIICADKLDTQAWLAVMRAAHATGLRSTSTIMFGHVESPRHWARHLLAIRGLQAETGGFSEFVPLPFVHMEAPLWRKGLARSGPSWREAMLMHAVSRLVLEPVLRNVQASWVKLGLEGALEALRAGANDLGGVLMNESITRAAGGVNGQQLDAASLRAAIASIGREPQQRSTLYARLASAQLGDDVLTDDVERFHRRVVQA
ncbi:MAG: 5-amino-6-(D-ribitylamino)uracil--L-tyrosine 4-hydroxyphenyl transferase CofH [Gammaproteobacteria bacterium]|nr:5-amino-6-(D-ribitylamino)uracil--L-tyrosine 4-hydroxyphenyl transferase CofH [Gammaproteobacteria bacterium]